MILSVKRLFFSGLALLLSACQILPQFGPTSTPPAAKTSVAGTVSAELTRSAFKTLAAQVTQTLFPTPGQPGQTIIPIVPSATRLLPTLTGAAASLTPSRPPANRTTTPTKKGPTRTKAPPTATPTPTKPPCNLLQFVKDMTVPDGTLMETSTAFKKVWRLKNVGSCTWTRAYTLVFIQGEKMGAPAEVNLPADVTPQGEIDVAVDLVAPAKAGAFQASYMLRSSSGTLFGYGAGADSPFWVKIVVQSPSPMPTPNGVRKDFAGNFCTASWTSASGSVTCPGSGKYSAGGMVSYSEEPHLENNSVDDEPTIILLPSDGSGGFISGEFPSVKVKSGEKFSALIGCLYDHPGCDATFELKYRGADSEIKSLGTWKETYDGKFQRLDVDLKALENQTVSFILTFKNNGASSRDNFFFIMVPKVTP